jgi:proline dehydrogenase
LSDSYNICRMPNVPDDLFENTSAAYAARSNRELTKAKWLFTLMSNQGLVSLGAELTEWALRVGLPLSPLFKYTVYSHFCGGETFDECKRTIAHLSQYKVGVMLNYGVELKETEADFDKTIQHNIEAIHFAGQHRDVRVLCIKVTGFGRFGLLEKMQRSETLTAIELAEYTRVVARMDMICQTAQQQDVAIYVDAEESWIQDPLDQLVDQMMAKYNTQKPIIYNTYQLYRHDRLAYLNRSLAHAQQHNYYLGAKLVRGAYMEKERERAATLGYGSPIAANKAAVDRDYDTAVTTCLQHIDRVSVCIASQSEASTLAAIRSIDQLEIARNHPHILFSQLYGMGDNITYNLAAHGFNATKYLPYGPVKDVIPYLMRRAQENTSVAGQTSRELSLLKRESKRRC